MTLSGLLMDSAWRGAFLVALGVCLLSPSLIPARAFDDEPDKAIAEIMKLGGRIERDEKADGKPVITVNFATTQVDDTALDLVKGFDKLKKLTLNGTKVTDGGLEKLKDLKSLQKLYLVDTKVGDAGLEHLKELTNLQILSLVGTQVSDAGIESIKPLAGLQEVYLYATKVTDEGIKALKEAIPKLKIDR
jgi:hypothetical protein